MASLARVRHRAGSWLQAGAGITHGRLGGGQGQGLAAFAHLFAVDVHWPWCIFSARRLCWEATRRLKDPSVQLPPVCHHQHSGGFFLY